MTALPHHRFCQEVVTQTGLLRGVVAGADLSVTVPRPWPRPARRPGPVWQVRWPAAAWARRAAHDLVVHRADAAGAVGADYAVAADLAVDAVDEFLDLLSNPQVAAAAPDPAGGPAPGSTVHLHATDAGPGLEAEWLVELGAPVFSWRHGHAKADVAVRAPLADLLRVVTRRLPPDAGGVEVLGDREVLDAWLERLRLQ
jgi:hypothetical protein